MGFVSSVNDSHIKSHRNIFSLYKIKSLNVTTSGRYCNTIFDVRTSKMPMIDQNTRLCVRGIFFK